MDIDGDIFRTAAAAGFGLFLAQGVPRALRSIYNWTSAMLFSSLGGHQRVIAMIFSAASLLWVLIIVQAIYSPIALLTPRILPYPDGLIRQLIFIEIWLLLILLPLVMGITQAFVSNGTTWQRLSMFPRSFVHVIGIALALFTLIPWILWRFVIARINRKKDEQLRLQIDVDQYESVAGWLIAGLESAGLSARTAELPRPVRVSRWFLHRIGPPILRPKSEYIAKRIVGDGYSLMIFDGLIDVVAERGLLSKVRMGLIGRLPPNGLWLTQSEGARELERLIRTEGAELTDVPRRIAEVDATLEEWRVLSWEYMQVMTKRASQIGESEPRPESGSFIPRHF